MNHQLCKAVIFLVFLFASAHMHAEAYEKDSVEKRIQSYDFSLRYSVLYPSGTQTFRLLKFESTSDFPPEGREIDPTGAPAFTMGVRFKKYNLYFSTNYVNFKILGETKVDLVPEENDTIPAGATTASEIRMSLLSLIVTRRIVQWNGGSFGIGAGLMLLPYKSEYSIEGLAESYTYDQLFPGPMITLNVEQQLNRFNFQVLAGILGAKINGNTIAYMNSDLSIKYAFHQTSKIKMEVLLAFKYIPFNMKVVNEPVTEYSLNADFFGPSVGLNLSILR